MANKNKTSDKMAIKILKPSIIAIIIIFFQHCTTNNIQQDSLAAKNFNIFNYDISNYNVKDFFPYKLSRFSNEINKFKIKDSLNMPDSGIVVFSGSSSIRKWKNIENLYKNFHAINRGFGGSTYPELIYYSKQLILKYKPKVIVIYEGDNDQYILTPYQIYLNVCKIAEIIHQNLPKTRILFLSVKPAPSRIKFIKSVAMTNTYIKHYCQTDTMAEYVDIFTPMFDSSGIRKDIFLKDSLHLNEKGYKIWDSVIRPYLSMCLKP